MKQIVLLCLLLSLWLPARSQTNPQADTSSLMSYTAVTESDILLDKGWKFHAGDNASWASPDLNDRSWQSINPTVDIHQLPQVKQAGIGWFRLRILLTEAVTKQALSLVIQQAGASDIYLDGRLIYKLGQVSADGQQEVAGHSNNRPYLLPILSAGQHVLAVRYSLSNTNYLINYTGQGNPCLELILKPTDIGFTDYLRQRVFIAAHNWVQVVSFLLIGITLLFLFSWYRTQKAYLFIGLYAVGSCLQTLLQILANYQSTSQAYAVSWFLSSFIATGSLLVLLIGVYRLNNEKLAWFNSFLTFLAVYALLTLPLLVLSYQWGWIIRIGFFQLVNLTILWLQWRAIRAGHSTAWIMFLTIVIYYVLSVSYESLAQKGYLPHSHFGNLFALWVIPIGLGLFFAGEFARLGKHLQIRVVEVEKLSNQVVRQEQEKQQLLEIQNETLERQVAERTAQLQQSLDNLKATQTQLIQSEKMASLGELTAGIAHEIQNPLNFVNNFSQVSADMIEELTEEQQKVERTPDLEVEILTDLKDNLNKIYHHGQRASSIVKGMLEHSRTSPGEAKPTDLNVLIDEYLRLAYHGLKGKDKEFDADLKTDLDPNLGNVDIVPQEIGRVLLNLFGNAFYAVRERQKRSHLSGTEPDYRPAVVVRTQRTNDQVKITVSDNGMGVPDAIKQKIFQPFFTTKPAGEGTGLGLSLSYDIITKGHRGILSVESWPGQGAEFTILLPAMKQVSLA